MADSLLKFSELLKENERNIKFNESVEPIDRLFKSMPVHSFKLAYSTYQPSVMTLGNFNSELIRLDEDDIEYFKNKYLPKINDEFQEELTKLKKRYNK